ncbi:hypothetical protein [Maridesulfovibrio hydrothermalis]|uniref:Glutamate synthase alpha subunit C-terminal domain-containing protein n=1 Tax=Maridesulfovibrio hydrothermalis AM13 = DSM 14728 TaxID=1121451 RepID=L0RFH0_9BACT|nr:hypothetical protein [Maridesulfovibrio hydrothermalis]CCO24316.1 conserved protein of unknown function [Maridesulfovibrio hydrothermalis AM13 = DSM 14728]
MSGGKTVIDAAGLSYRRLNEMVREYVHSGVREFVLDNVIGQRYIATALKGEITFEINGTPGQDLAAFMRGPRLIINGNTQDGVGNTMDDGKIVINGIAGDVLGYAMRGGAIYVHGDVGYRVGIHMKSYMDQQPVIVIGGKAGDFLGEYMAGGVILLLGMFSGKPDSPVAGMSLGTGMHGGVIYVRGEVSDDLTGPEIRSDPADKGDLEAIAEIVRDYSEEIGVDADVIMASDFTRLLPRSHRPYGNMYVPV